MFLNKCATLSSSSLKCSDRKSNGQANDSSAKNNGDRNINCVDGYQNPKTNNEANLNANGHSRWQKHTKKEREHIICI